MHLAAAARWPAFRIPVPGILNNSVSYQTAAAATEAATAIFFTTDLKGFSLTLARGRDDFLASYTSILRGQHRGQPSILARFFRKV